MLDGIQDKTKYPSDFFIDLVFQDGEKELVMKEDKNKLWAQIGESCSVRRKFTDKGPTTIEELKTNEYTEAEPEFVIEASTPDETPEGKVEENKKIGSLEEEAIRMHKELLEDDEVKKEEKKGEAQVKTEIKKVTKRKGSAEREKKEKQNESKKAETEREVDENESDDEANSVLSNVMTLIKSSR